MVADHKLWGQRKAKRQLQGRLEGGRADSEGWSGRNPGKVGAAHAPWRFSALAECALVPWGAQAVCRFWVSPQTWFGRFGVRHRNPQMILTGK